MTGWDWLTKGAQGYSWGFAGRVLIKAGVLFVVLNVVFALLNPLPALGQLSVYNGPLPGRLRLPYGEDAARSYNLSLNSLEAMFASHEINSAGEDEFRVLVLGDSSTWGFLLPPEQTLTAYLNELALTTADGQRVHFYNLGYPIMSLTKDLLLLDYAMRYDPDLIVWLVTAESFPPDKQLFPPLVQGNPGPLRDLIAAYDLNLDPQDERLAAPDFLGQTIFGQRRALADLLRLQLYAVPWAVTGIDQHLPDDYPLRSEDFEEDLSWGDAFPEPQPLSEADLAFDVLRAGLARAGDVPVLLVNEPMFLSGGVNSDLRYNFFYPRWAYDTYHALLGDIAADEDWLYLDLWDALPNAVFTDSPVHYTPEGAALLAELVGAAVEAMLVP